MTPHRKQPAAGAVMVEKWTPGPWVVYKRASEYGWRVVRPAGDAELGDWTMAERVRREEDARLIAAVPDMAIFVAAHAARGDANAIAIMEKARGDS